MKFFIAIFIFFISLQSQAQTLITPNYIIKIQCNSDEHEVGCDNASYEGISKKTGKTIHLSGKQLMKLCADGVTPCHSLGYEFYNGETRYLVTEGGELIVSQGVKIILDESGQWQE